VRKSQKQNSQMTRPRPKSDAKKRTTLEPQWPDPLSKRALRGLAGEFVKLVAPTTEADEPALLFQFLTAFGSVVGREPHVMVGATRHGANLFCGVVAESGQSQKGASFEYVAAIFGDLDKNIVEGLSTGEGLITALEERESPRALVMESEMGATFKRGGRLSQVLRQAWDGKNLSVLTRTDPLRLCAPHISIIGHVTPEELRLKLVGVELVNGFANRFLWPLARRSKYVAMPKSVSSFSMDEIATRLRIALGTGASRGEMKLSQRALELWEREYKRLVEQSSGAPAPVVARAAPNVMRLALIYALLDQAKTIKLQHVRAGLAAWRYASDSATWIFAMPDPIAGRVLEMIRSNTSGITRSELRDGFGRHHTARIGVALAQLEERQLVATTVRKTRGRSAQVWQTRA
jgi:hypothetical protein